MKYSRSPKHKRRDLSVKWRGFKWDEEEFVARRNAEKRLFERHSQKKKLLGVCLVHYPRDERY